MEVMVFFLAWMNVGMLLADNPLHIKALNVFVAVVAFSVGAWL